MEKFGIFELLDALSAIALPDAQDGEKSAHDDPVYAPPVYTAEEKAKEAPPETKKPPVSTGEFAIHDFYKRHDERAKK